MEAEYEHRYGVFTRERKRFHYTGTDADTEEGGRLALRTLAGDAAEAGAKPDLHGLYDRKLHRWIVWPWGCDGCGRATLVAPHRDRRMLCADCRRDRNLGEPLGTSRAEDEPDRIGTWRPEHVEGWSA